MCLKGGGGGGGLMSARIEVLLKKQQRSDSKEFFSFLGMAIQTQRYNGVIG